MKKWGTVALILLGFVAIVAWTPSPAALGVVPTVFLLKRSNNVNEVHYKALVYEEDCTFSSDYPIRGYWRNFAEGEHGPYSKLLDRERAYYGVTVLSKKSVKDTDRVLVQVNAFPERRITVRARIVKGHCTALAFVTIQRRLAVLDYVYIKLAFLSVDYIKLVGHDSKTGKRLTERVDI
jgi:hypothetical protein